MLGWACLRRPPAGAVRPGDGERRAGCIRQAVPLRPERLPIDLESLRRAVGLRTAVRWAVDARLDSPAVGGLLRPAVVIPPDLNDSLTPNQLTWVLLHELAHVRRGDLWVVVFQRVVQAVFFFNPAVHLANWIIDELREYACDDAALAACKTSRRDCGEGFLAIIERSAGHAPVAAPALGLFEGRMLIRRRLLRILDNHRTVHARLSRPAAFGLLVLALALFVLPYGAPRRRLGWTAQRPPITSRPRHVARRSRPAARTSPRATGPGAVWHHAGRAGPRRRRTARRRRRTAAPWCSQWPTRRTATMLASAGDDAVVRLRDLASGRVVGRLEGHRDAVSCLAFSPDGKTLATGSYDRTVKLWDVATRRLQDHAHRAHQLGLLRGIRARRRDRSPRAVTTRRYGSGTSATGRETATLAGHSASVRAVAFAPGAQREPARLRRGGPARPGLGPAHPLASSPPRRA